MAMVARTANDEGVKTPPTGLGAKKTRASSALYMAKLGHGQQRVVLIVELATSRSLPNTSEGWWETETTRGGRREAAVGLDSHRGFIRRFKTDEVLQLRHTNCSRCRL